MKNLQLEQISQSIHEQTLINSTYHKIVNENNLSTLGTNDGRTVAIIYKHNLQEKLKIFVHNKQIRMLQNYLTQKMPRKMQNSVKLR
jgi:hypothetical protein